MKLNANKKPTKNFGRLVAILHTSELGEMESVFFRDGYTYFGLAPHKLLDSSYVFYKLEFKLFQKAVKKIS